MRIQHLILQQFDRAMCKLTRLYSTAHDTLMIMALIIIAPLQTSWAANAPPQILKQFQVAQAVEVIIEYDDSAIEQTSQAMRLEKKRPLDDNAIRIFKRQEYKTLKESVDKQYISNDVVDLKNYSDLPVKFKRFKNEKAFRKYIATKGVKAVYENKRLQRVQVESLPLINQPNVAQANAKGAGTTVAVLDDGIDLTNAAFGPCTAPNVPSSTCKVVVAQDFAAEPATDKAHGTNVSAIVLGVAPAAKIAMLNVFSSDGAFVSDIIDAINWSIANKSTFNIQAMNLSLGGDTKFTSACTNDWSKTPIQNARNAGITVVIASGNSGFTDGIASPACAPAAISVGAVYDANIGGVNFGACQDTTTNADKVTCFSNSANFLTLLAPGAAITAAGITQYGTSQAAPHVAGAVAVLRALYPNETLSQTQSRLTSSGTPVLDPRNNITKPRLNLLAAARPSNDNFANRMTLTGASGSITGQSILASKESNEPNHAGNAGGASVWWKWVATANGQLSLSTNGSAFDTLLAVYQGNSLNSISAVASNDNELTNVTSSRVYLQTIAGREYQIAVDGTNINGSQTNKGAIALAWSLNTNPAADVAITLSGPNSIQLGQTYTYTMTVNNAGPQAATLANLVFTIPSGASLVTTPDGCVLNTNLLTCAAPLIVNGASQAFTMQLLWNALTASVQLTASVSTEVPDNHTANNTNAMQVSLNTNTGGDAGSGNDSGTSQSTDVPTLPEWAAIGLMLILLWQNTTFRKP